MIPKNFRLSRAFACLLLSFLIICSFSASTFAQTLNARERLIYGQNNILFYNPYENFNNSGCFAGLGSYDGIVTAGLSELQASFVDTYHDIAAELSAEYGIPWEAVMAQGIYESGAGTSEYARERNNFFGINAVDVNPDLASGFPTPQDGWKGYYQFIDKNRRYREHGAFDYPNDPYGYLQAILAAGYATKTTYFEEASPIIKAIENRAKEKGWPLSSESPGGATGVSNLYGCDATTQGNGDINKTALAFSWPDRTHDVRDPKPEYTKALEEVGLNTYGDEWVRIGSSCDAFVATVLRFSGADPDVVCCGAANMLNYFATHPDLYEEIPNLSNSSNLQPGDIRARPGHVELYVIDEEGNGRIASASHGDRTADHARDFYANSEYRVFRLKGVKNE